MRIRDIAAAAILLGVALAPRLVNAADTGRTLEWGGRERSYSVHLPPGGARGQMALVVVLHGGAGSGKGAAKQTHFSAEADKLGFIVAYPDGTDRKRPLISLFGKAGFLTWNAGGCCAYAMENRIDDVDFTRAMVAGIEKDFPIDRARVYATGISNGAIMSYRLACDASDIFAAVGPVAGVVFPPCKPREPVAVIDIQGSDDSNMPVKGGVGDKAFTKTDYPPLQDSISLLAGADNCREQPVQSQPMKDVRLTDYTGCRTGTEVALYMVEGGGHSWPGGERMARFLDAPSPALDATDVI